MQRTDIQPAERDNEFEHIEALFDEVRLLAQRLSRGCKSEEDAFAGSALSIFRALSEHGSQTVPQIARLRATSRQNVQILVNRLAGDGLVEFASNPAHKRSELVTMTVAGRTVFAKAEQQEAEFVAGLVSRLPEAGVAAASAVLRRIRELLGEGGKSSKSQYSTRNKDERSKASGDTEEGPMPEAGENELPYNLL